MPNTPNYGWETPNIGGDRDAWGGSLNAAINAIDGAVKTVANAAAAALSYAQTQVARLDGNVNAVSANATNAGNLATNAYNRVGALEAQNLSARIDNAQGTANNVNNYAVGQVGRLDGRIDATYNYAAQANANANARMPVSGGGFTGVISFGGFYYCPVVGVSTGGPTQNGPYVGSVWYEVE